MLDVFHPQANFPVLPYKSGHGYCISRLYWLQVMIKRVVSVDRITLLTCSDRYQPLWTGPSESCPPLRQMTDTDPLPESCVWKHLRRCMLSKITTIFTVTHHHQKLSDLTYGQHRVSSPHAWK
jgi:hypothetical protein